MRFGRWSPANIFGELMIERTIFPRFAMNLKRRSASKNPEPSWRSKLAAVRSWTGSWHLILRWQTVSQSSGTRRRVGMIVRSMRLKNIKSYGEGPEGDGVTISFEPGTNRIAGKNGHGKTTLIESLGYALFLSEPIFEENFQLETYLLRAGKKAAEIDVTFGHRGEFFRIERGLGPNSKRQTKVVQIEDGSSCAEGAREVSAFLCRLFDLPNPKRLSELFWKLIGVRQGRLTWPFDSKPSVAKDFFEPLLDVAVFRRVFRFAQTGRGRIHGAPSRAANCALPCGGTDSGARRQRGCVRLQAPGTPRD